MLANQAQATEKVTLLPAASRGAGADSGAWIDVSKYEGDLLVVLNTGELTGGVDYKLEDADDGAGANSADVPGATHAGVADTAGAIFVNANAVRGFVRLTATVTTGPVLSGGVLVAHPKYT